ncbi:MAG: hypothetical protein JST68_20185 [Bacteroidetes bacterium]|nr:hypothetical protein [Bacteroidota bacterium]
MAFAFVPFLCLYTYFDRRVKLRVDSEGIWSSKKGKVGWDEMWGFSSDFKKGPRYGDIYQLHARLKDTETRLDMEVVFRFQNMDKKFSEIRSVVEYYAGKYKIEDLGNEELF